jgi:D-galactonate transporter
MTQSSDVSNLRGEPLEAVDTAAVYTRIRWRIMPFLILCYVVAFIDRTNIGVAKLGFVHDLGFDEAIYGFGAGIFYLGYVLLEIPSNYFLERIGIRRTLLRIMLIWGACCSAMALMSTATEFYILRFLLGAAEAGLFPGILLYVTYWIPQARRARITALFMASIAIAGVIGGPLAGWIMHSTAQFHGIAGWRWLFLIEGLPAVLLGVIAFYYLDDGPEKASWLSAAEREWVSSELQQDRARRAQSSQVHHTFASTVRDPRFFAVAALGFAVMVSTAGVFLWLPTIIQHSGIQDIVEIGLLSALPFLVGFVAQFLVARSSDRQLERRWHSAIPAAVAAIGWLLLPFAAKQPVLALLLLTLTASGTLAAMGPFWSLPASFLSGPAVAGGIALITTIAGFGNFISPILVGYFTRASGTLAAGQVYFGILLLLGAGLMLAVVRAPAQDVRAAA